MQASNLNLLDSNRSPDEVEDVSYGFYLWQLTYDRQATSVTIFDRDEAS